MHMNLATYRFSDNRFASAPPKRSNLTPRPKEVLSYDRQNLARQLADEAVSKNKIFILQGPYNTVREYLRSKGWVERFYHFSIYRKKIPSKRTNSPDIMMDGDGNVIDLEDHGGAIAPWREDGGFYGFMSRLVQKVEPNLFWGIRRDVFDMKLIGLDPMINHFAHTVFTSKTGLCKYLKELPWYAEGHCQNFYPRAYQLAKPDEKEAFQQDFCFTAAVSLLNILRNCYYEKHIKNECNVYEVPEKILSKALMMCQSHLDFLSHDDIDMSDIEEFSLHTKEEMLQVYYKARNFDGLVITNNMDASKVVEIDVILKQLSSECPQFSIDGTKNIWILKPGAKSRGRGIQIFDNLKEILKMVEFGAYINERKYVIQKYIESPLLIHRTKFDIRQWFLVTNWNPLTVWFYKDSYLRFCSQEFTLDDFSLCIHLTNNSIQKHYLNGQRSKDLPKENMWTCHEFKEYLAKIEAPVGTWDEIYEGMKKSVINSLLCCQETVEHRKNSFELFGADFMLNEDFDPWLIEINSSPCMAPSTSITAKMCPSVLEDTLKVVLDKSKGTGLFELVYKQNYIIVPSFLGSTLQITGKPVFSQARLKLLQKLQRGTNTNKNAQRIVSLKKNSTDDSSSDSQSISLPSSPNVEEEVEEEEEEEEEEEDSLPKKKEVKKKRKAFRKVWKNRCCKCRRNGRMKCSCSGGMNLIRTLNLTLKLESSKPVVSSAEPDGDSCDSTEAFTSEDFISRLTEKNFHPEKSIAKSPSHQMLSTNSNVVLTKTTLILEPSAPPKSLVLPRSNPVKVRKLKKHFVPDSASRRKSALSTFINQLSLRPVVKKIGLEHLEFGP